MRLKFWKREGKDNPVSRVTFTGLGLSGVSFPKLNERRYVKDGFNANITVYQAVMQIAQADAGIPWVLYHKGATTGSKPQKLMSFAVAAKAMGRNTRLSRKAVQTSEVTNHPLLMLLERPNPLQGGAELQEMRTAWLLIHGNGYTVPAGPSNAPPRELWAVRPDRMKVQPDPKLWVKGFTYEVNGEKQTFAAGQVLHRKMFSADNDYYGMSPLHVAMKNVLTNNEAVKWNYALLLNSCRPPGAFVSKLPVGLTDAQFNRAKTQMDEEYAGANNAGRPLLLEGDLDWKSMGLTPAEMEWLAGLKDGRRQIASAFSVAPELIGDAENKTYANYGEARKALYQENVLPGKDRDRDALNNWLVPMFGDGLYLDYDRDQIEALEEDQEKVWGRVEASSTLTINEKRQLLGYDDLKSEEGGDVVLVSAAMTPLNELVTQAAQATDQNDLSQQQQEQQLAHGDTNEQRQQESHEVNVEGQQIANQQAAAGEKAVGDAIATLRKSIRLVKSA